MRLTVSKYLLNRVHNSAYFDTLHCKKGFVGLGLHNILVYFLTHTQYLDIPKMSAANVVVLAVARVA